MVAGATAAASQAAAPVHLTNIDISSTETIPAGDLCAFDVTTTFSGAADVTLWTNDAGLVVRERSDAPGAKATFSGNGKSFSFPADEQVEIDFGSGAVLGGSATLKVTGLFDHVPGVLSSDAGQVVFDATVLGFASVDGAEIPLTAGGTLQVQHGSVHPGDAVAAAICAARS